MAQEEEETNLEAVGWTFVVLGTLMSLLGSYLVSKARQGGGT